MGFYIRKSVSVGPFRFNLSKSGVGVSAGVRGFRVGTGPRGNYVNIGRGGVYYRATLNPASASRARPARQPATAYGNHPVIPAVEMHEIESADATSIVDSSSAELVAEMNEKRKMLRVWPFVFWGGLGLSGLVGSEWIVAVTAIATLAAVHWDKLRKTTVLLYELDDDAESKFQRLHGAFEALGGCGGRWHISARGDVRDGKYHAGANSLVRRTGIRIAAKEAPYLKSNISVPAVPVGKQTLYFFPDKLLIFEPNAVGAVSYAHLVVDVASTKFVEEERVPRDAQVVDRTWRYVNKKGGPDKRFKDNRELPVALYEQVAFSSESGLNEVIQVSRVGLGEEVATAVKSLASVAPRP